MKTIIIGLGNPILSDDGVGWKVVEKLQAIAQDQSSVVCETASLGGLSLMERMVGFERAILVDALETAQSQVGSVRVFALADLPNPSAGHSASAHDTSLLTALEMGRRMGLVLPAEIQVVAIETRQVYDFSEDLSPVVAAAVPLAVQAVLKLLAKEKESA